MQRKTRFNSSFSGFSLIELLVVTTIIIVLSVIGLISYQSTSRNARNAKRKADLESVRSALVLYRSDTGEYPPHGGADQNAFDDAITDLHTAEYYSSATLTDPQDTGLFVYTYDSDGITFELCGYLEPKPGVKYCLNNP